MERKANQRRVYTVCVKSWLFSSFSEVSEIIHGDGREEEVKDFGRDSKQAKKSQLRWWAMETWLCLRIKLINYKDGRDEKNKSIAKGSWAGQRISAGDPVCATWEQDCRKRMLGDRQGQQLVGKKEDRVVYLKALFKYMIRARQTQKPV